MPIVNLCSIFPKLHSNTIWGKGMVGMCVRKGKTAQQWGESRRESVRNSRRNCATLSTKVGQGGRAGIPLQAVGRSQCRRCPTPARGGGEFPKELCCVERSCTKAGKKREERGQWGTERPEPHLGWGQSITPGMVPTPSCHSHCYEGKNWTILTGKVLPTNRSR